MKNLAIITGASSGMGAEFARQLAETNDYDEIWILARRIEKLEALANDINSRLNSKIIKTFQIDVRGQDGALKFKAFLDSLGNDFSIKMLINNAGFGTYGPFNETDALREMEMIDVNCTALTGICSFALPYLNKNSCIINTASLAAFMPLGNFAVYAATKSYVLSFSVALAAELKPLGIKVCALCPGSVSTEFANVASNGVRKEVKGGRDPVKVVRHCLKSAAKGKKIALCYPKWKFTAFLSRLVGRFLVANFTFKFNKRPH